VAEAVKVYIEKGRDVEEEGSILETTVMCELVVV
jgi:hypothetical protein